MLVSTHFINSSLAIKSLIIANLLSFCMLFFSEFMLKALTVILPLDLEYIAVIVALL
jgi:hypothetical protein